MSGLTRVFTQTHRHYSSRTNVITTEDARSYSYPLLAECGQVWIPNDASLTADLPMCPHCDRTAETPLRVAGKPHFVYRCYDRDGNLIYVGCSVAPIQRMEQHRANTWWFDQVERIRYVVYPNKDYALYKEREAIGAENPRWNIKGRNHDAFDLADYRDIHCAMAQNGASGKRLEAVRAKAQLKFGTDITEPIEAVA